MPELLPDGRFEAGDDPLRPEAGALLASWARRVRANAEQVDRFGELRHEDHYAPVATRFRADPRRTDDPSLDALLSLARPDETWLDIGAGGGRYALPLALKGASEELRNMFFTNMSERASKMLREEMSQLGPVRLKDVDSAQARIVLLTKELAAKGEIMIAEGGGEDELIY